MTTAQLEIDGTAFTTLEGFYDEVTTKIVSGASWGKNLDAFNDILGGGFGSPEEGFILVWRNSELSRRNLGYAETVRQLKLRLERCHPSARESVRNELKMAERRRGPTVFDWLVDIISQHPEVRLCLQ